MSCASGADGVTRGIKIPVAVNVSPRTLLDQDLPQVVGDPRARWDVPPRYLRLELTENFLVADSGRSDTVLNDLSQARGSLDDDFGTGFSSLSYLKRLPIEEIKIDRSFVSHMMERVEDFTIVRATVELGRNLGLRVVAEGVQDRETFDGSVTRVQRSTGLLHRPAVEPEAFWRWLSHREMSERSRYPGRRTCRTSTGSSAPSRIPLDAPSRRDRVRVVVFACAGGWMSLRDVLDALVGAAPIERLLLERARIVAKV